MMLWNWGVLLSLACTCLKISNGSVSEKVDDETVARIRSMVKSPSETQLATSMFAHLSSSSNSEESSKPYAALFQVLFNSSSDDITHYPTTSEMHTILQNKLVQRLQPSPKVSDRKEGGERSAHVYENIEARGDSAHYLPLVNHILASSSVSSSLSSSPRLVVEMNCDQYQSSSPAGVGIWGSIHLLTRQDQQEKEKEGKQEQKEGGRGSHASADGADGAPPRPPMVLCANKWHIPDIFTASGGGGGGGGDTGSKRKEVFLKGLQAHNLDDVVLPITLTTGATATTTWLEQFKWTVDVIHFNDYSCDTFWDCCALASSSLALLRPGGVMTVHIRNTMMVKVFRALRDFSPEDSTFIHSQRFVGVSKSVKPSDGATGGAAVDTQRQNRNQNAFITNLLLRLNATSTVSGCDATESLCEEGSHSPSCPSSSSSSLSSLVLAVNLIESHIDAQQLPQLVAVINANYAHAGNTLILTTEQLLDIYERHLLRQFQCHATYPLPQDRRDHLGASMAAAVSAFTLSDLHVEPDSIWTFIMTQLLHAQKSQHELYHRYYELTLHPPFFHWEEQLMTSAGGPIFRALLSHPDYFRWAPLQNTHRAGDRFLFGVIPVQAADEHNGIVYRPGRTQHVYSIFMLRVVLGLWPEDFEQIIDYGGGTGDTAVSFRQLGFSGQYFIYDLPPVLYLQQYFLRYSGWPAYVVDDTNVHLHHTQFASSHRSGASATLLVSSLSDVLDRVTDRSDEVLKKTLFYATFSLTESPIEARDKIVKTLVGVGVIFLRMKRIYEKFDNREYVLQLGEMLNDHPEHAYGLCFSIGGRDTITFIFHRVPARHRTHL